MLKYYDYFLDARSEQISGYVATIAKLDQIEPQITQHTQQLKRKQQQLEQRHRELEQQRQSRRQTLAKINQILKDKDLELQQLQQDRENLNLLIREVHRSAKQLPYMPGEPFAKLKGRLQWPTNGKLANRFGSARVAGRLTWSGVMIRAALGKDIAAVHQGRVVFAEYLRGQGMLIIIDHGGGYMSLYGHNQMLLKQAGDWVEGGEPIATVGNTGGQTQAGLYFEIRKDGQPQNPALWCRG